MTRVRGVLVAVLALTLLALPDAGAAAPPAEPRTIYLDGVPVRRWTPEHRQVITVNRTSGTYARITLWRYADGQWTKRSQSSQARIGYGGLVRGVDREQGTGTTPIGTYSLPFTFGSDPKLSSWDLPYKDFDNDDYWVQDNKSAYYNRYRDRDTGGFRWWLDPSRVNASERLADYSREYEMAVVIAFNYYDPVAYRGAGIFLHVNGRGATAGCVSAPRWFLQATMARLSPELEPVIAIGW